MREEGAAFFSFFFIYNLTDSFTHFFNMTKAKPRPSIELSISKLSSKGNGIGAYHHPAGIDWTVEVPFTIPHDVVRVTLRTKQSGTYQSFLEEIISPSPARQESRCIHFGICGGCRWQQVPYATQLQWKEKWVRECFQGILNENSDFRPIVPCENEWEYRNKMEFSFSQNIQGERFLGLMIDAGRGKVLNITECHLVRPWFMIALKAVRSWWEESGLQAYHPRKNTGSLRVLTVREGMRTNDKIVMLTVSGVPEFALVKEQIDSFNAVLRSAIGASYPNGTLSIFLRIQQAQKGVETTFYEIHLGGPDHLRECLSVSSSAHEPAEQLSFHVSPSAFFQPNTFQAEKFYSLALQLVKATRESVVYDLYCGTGTIGLSLAKHVKQVVGIEMSPESSLDARNNAKLNRIDNYTVVCGDVRHVLKSVLEEMSLPFPDVVIIDPPRVGLDAAAIESLIAFKAPKIVYISCNPKTQALNIAAMIDAGYCLEIIQPVDQFPHTVHTENIAVLSLLS